MKKSKKIYLDCASATPIDSVVLKRINEVFKENFANPNSTHDLGVKTRQKLERAREDIAEILGAHNNEVVFTSGATESNNLAILGVLAKQTELFLGMPTYLSVDKLFCLASQPVQNISKNTQFVLPHIITTNIEHPSVLEVCKYLERTKQAEVTFVPVEPNGIVDPKKIRKAIKLNTILISVMYANNEIGTIQPIREIAKEIRHYKKMQYVDNYEGLSFVKYPIFHTDATQAINYLPIKVEKLGIDLMSFNAGKIYGPKGVGALYVRRKIPLNKIMFGGNQEFNLRPGTENLPLIVGFAEVLKITEKIKNKEEKRLTKLRDYFIEKITKLNPDINIKINGDLKERLPNNINISISKIPSDLLVIELSARGIYVSEKSACKSGDKAGSYVIQALNQNSQKTCKKESSLRFSLGRQTTKDDIDYTLKSLFQILNKLKKWYT